MISDAACSAKHSMTSCTRVWAIEWNHRGTVLASCGDDKTIKLWKYTKDAYATASSSLLQSSCISDSHTRAIRHLAFSPDDQFLASASFDSVIVVYQLYSGDYEEVSRLEGHENEVKCCTFSTCGHFLASCSRDKSVWFWQLDEGGDFEVSSILQSHSQDVKFIVWHPLDNILVSCSYDCSIRFYQYDGDEWITQHKIDNAHKDTVWSADFSADGKLLATVGADSAINVWQQQSSLLSSKVSWIKLANLILNTRWPLYTISWNKLHGTIAVGGGDCTIRLLRFAPASAGDSVLEEVDKQKLKAEINCLKWNPVDGSQLASATDDGIVCVFDVIL